MDRGALAEWSLDVADDGFPPALAALGTLAALAPATLGLAHEPPAGWNARLLAGLLWEAQDAATLVWPWQLPDLAPGAAGPQWRIRVAGQRGMVLVAAPPAHVLAEVWQAFIAHGAPRLAVQTTPATAAQALGLAGLLTHASVQAAGVYVATTYRPEGRPDWRWPMTLATLPGDPLTEPLAAYQRYVQPNWPFRFKTASRERARFEVLVIGAGASDALMRLLASKLALRCSLVIVAGLGTDAPAEAEPLLQALVARLSAEGVAVLDSGGSAHAFAGALNQFAYELTHNKTIDVALLQAFGPGVWLRADPRLFKRARLDTDIARAQRRLRRLAPDTELALSDRSFERLGVPAGAVRGVRPAPVGAEPPEPASAAGPAQIAEAIEAAKAGYAFHRESEEASAVAELNRSLGVQERAARRERATPRYVQQRSFRKVDGRFVAAQAGYVVGQPVMVQVHIGPRREGVVAAPTAFPEDKLPPQREAHRLQVVFYEHRQFDQPLLREISLPRQGDSSAAAFVFTPRTPGVFEGRLSVLHRGRVLQTVLLKTTVAATAQAQGEGAITLEDEAQVRHDWSDLGRRRQFDLALVVNHTPAGEPTATGVMGQRAWATSLEGLDQPVRKLNDLISTVAHSTADYGDGLDQGENPQLLNKLARVGANLYSLLYRDQLKQLATEGFDVGDDAVSHIQVISARPDAVVPLEFMYDYNAPEPGAPVCPQHRQALEAGRCPATCERAAKPRGYVCPMGFWGLKKVIERHLFDPKAATPVGAQVTVQVEPLEGRDRLELASGALVGYSQEVQAADVQALVGKLTAAFGTAAPVVKDWDEWAAAVQARQPALLVAFPHNEGKEEDVLLEIGGNKLYTLDLPADYVRPQGGPPPLVFLLGCDVAGTAQDFSSHIRYFRQAGAAVVVSTIATVFGAHAARVGEAIVSGLLPTEASDRARLGEVIRDAKRAALLASVPMALCVVAFGDADWRL